MFDVCLNQGRMVGWNRTVGGCVRVEKRGGETDFKKGASWVKG